MAKDVDIVGPHEAARDERELDLLTSNHGAFRWVDREKILAIAHARESAGEIWLDIVRDFHASEPRYWGFSILPTGHKDTKRPKTEAELRSRDVFTFFWAAFQSLIILKLIILYFGLNYAQESDDSFGALNAGAEHSSGYGWGLAIGVAVSFGGLLVFAIRKSRDRSWN